ncbi:hypothetical protein [Caviibacter abscessus]|uniref:hypothetical protein n=1 Tax=Caviibacter abscessus TaxID=1766719 RepID=UPI000830A2C9|nr:hypothetical protein [Caviibacter abscessus]
MKKIIYSIFLIVFMACTANNVTTEKIDYDNTYSSFVISTNQFIELAKQNKKKDIDKFFVHTLKNRIILNELKKQDFSNILLFIPENKINILSNNKINSLLVINFGTTSNYFDVVWIKDNDIWKIYDVYERH